MENIFNESNRLARDIAGENWFKFTKAGDKVGGIVRDMWEKPKQDQFPPQRCFTLEQEGGKFVNVGLKRSDYILTRTDMLQIGDSLGIKYEKDIPPKVKGFSPAKSMVIFTKLNGPRTGIAAKDLKPVSETSVSEEDEDVSVEDIDLN